jgi:uncharacterized protein (DUF58 family)
MTLVPRARLLLWVALIVLPFALLGGLEPDTLGVSLAIIGGFFALAVGDAVAARGALAGVTVQLPAIVRMSRDREALLDLRVRNERQRPQMVRIGLALPSEIDSLWEDTFVALPGGSEWSRFSWSCVPRRRGRYRIESVRLEAASRLGFWGMRKAIEARSELRVYPSLFRERKDLAALFLHRGGFGLHAQRQVGRGRDFEKLREYIPGDGYDEIHWKATAKRGQPVTKVFQIERTQEVYVVIDASRLSARSPERPGPAPAPPGSAAGVLPELETAVLERFITASLVLGLAAEQQGDLFGVLAFSNKVETFLRAKNGKAHYSACRDALYSLEPQGVTPDYDEVCAFIRLRLRRRALILFLTSLDDPVLAESFVRNIDLIRRQHLVLVSMIQPAGVAPLFTRLNLATVDEVYQHLGGHLLWHKLRELEKVLQRRGVRFSLLKNERLSAELVSQYMGVKQRQMI